MSTKDKVELYLMRSKPISLFPGVVTSTNWMRKKVRRQGGK